MPGRTPGERVAVDLVSRSTVPVPAHRYGGETMRNRGSACRSGRRRVEQPRPGGVDAAGRRRPHPHWTPGCRWPARSHPQSADPVGRLGASAATHMIRGDHQIAALKALFGEAVTGVPRSLEPSTEPRIRPARRRAARAAGRRDRCAGCFPRRCRRPRPASRCRSAARRGRRSPGAAGHSIRRRRRSRNGR